uniref:Photosynthetic NDH subunit of subcomplex B 4, chloroplastic n=1 Tax=Oryza glumipatula TaxID=40148 RepID=A0A0D9YY53_9ORYZ
MALPLLKSSPHFSALHSANRAQLHGRCRATLGGFHDPRSNSSRCKKSAGRGSVKANASPLDVVTLMVTMVEHVDLQRDYVVHKSIWHLSDAALKSVYTFYAFFTVWGICFFASMKASTQNICHYNLERNYIFDIEAYRGQGGDGTVHWYYDRQEDLEASAREELLREELLEEIEQRVGGLRELEEAAKEEQLTN